ALAPQPIIKPPTPVAVVMARKALRSNNFLLSCIFRSLDVSLMVALVGLTEIVDEFHSLGAPTRLVVEQFMVSDICAAASPTRRMSPDTLAWIERNFAPHPGSRPNSSINRARATINTKQFSYEDY
ncbi:MAG: hypothetical protein ACR2OV_11330, partial [Hyphomicrobiaceae bacterium]